MSRDVHSCTHWLRPRNPRPHPHAFGLVRALLVSKYRRHLFVTPWLETSNVKGRVEVGGGAGSYFCSFLVVEELAMGCA
jgi:hypothetical protein